MAVHRPNRRGLAIALAVAAEYADPSGLDRGLNGALLDGRLDLSHRVLLNRSLHRLLDRGHRSLDGFNGWGVHGSGGLHGLDRSLYRSLNGLRSLHGYSGSLNGLRRLHGCGGGLNGLRALDGGLNGLNVGGRGSTWGGSLR